jgi:hypothetical protein
MAKGDPKWKLRRFLLMKGSDTSEYFCTKNKADLKLNQRNK